MSAKTLNKIDNLTIKMFIEGDMRAFDEIYHAFCPKLQKFVYSLIKTKDETEEIVQDVFVKVWENRLRIRDFNCFENYLFTIAYHITINLLRKRTKDTNYIEYIKSIQIEIDDSGPEDILDWQEFDNKLNLIIEQMPARQKEVFKMRYLLGLTYKEIAKELGLSINTIENHVVSAHKSLKKKLGKSYLPALLFIYLFS